MKIIAQEVKIFKRTHDNILMGNEISLGVDYSTGKPREDKEEYYTQIDKPERKIMINPKSSRTTTIL